MDASPNQLKREVFYAHSWLHNITADSLAVKMKNTAKE
jgi:hypothetical protein